MFEDPEAKVRRAEVTRSGKIKSADGDDIEFITTKVGGHVVERTEINGETVGTKRSKTCTRCQELKPYSEFHNRSGTTDGLQYYCKACIKEYDGPRDGDARRIHRNDKPTVRQFEVFRLHHVIGMSQQEIANDLGISQQAVSKLLKRTYKVIGRDYSHARTGRVIQYQDWMEDHIDEKW